MVLQLMESSYNSTCMKKLFILITVIMVIATLFQIANLSGEYGSNLISIRHNLGKSGMWRGANFNQSQKVADYIEFLSRNIPESARVVIPSFGGDSKIFVNPYMQFFLAPREVINCNNLECLQEISRENTYIIIVGNLSPGFYQYGSYIMFDENWGLLPPDNFSADKIPELASFNTFRAIIRALVAPLLWLTVLTLTGTLFSMALLPGRERLLHIALGYGLGLGLFSIGITVSSLLGFNINTRVIIVLTGTLLALALSTFYLSKNKFESTKTSLKSDIPKGKIDFWPILFLVLGCISIILAVGKGYHRIDAIQIWGAKGYGIASDGSLGSITDWGTNTLPYPLHIPVLVAAFRVLFGDVLPSSKLIFGGYYLAIMMVGYFTLLAMGVKRWLSVLAVMLLFTTPIIFRHSTIGYANLAQTFYLLSGVVVFLPVFVGRLSLGNLFLSGLCLACAAWTRPEGLMMSFCGVGLLLIFAHLDKHIHLNWRKALSFLAPLVIYLLFWQVLKQQIYEDPLSKTSLTSDALAILAQGEFHIKEVFFIFAFLMQELQSFDVWGVLGIVLFIMCIIVVIFRKSVSRNATVMIAIGGMFLLMIIGMYYLTSFDSVHDLNWWVSSGLNRMIFPGIIVLWLGIIAAFHDHLDG